MITVLLRGGLGNQMFQYAAGLAMAQKYKTKLFLDTVLLRDRFPRKQITFRTYDLDIFKLTPEFTALSRLSSGLPIPGFWVAADLSLIKVRSVLGGQKVLKEKKEFVFDPSVSEAGDNTFLWGYWQTSKYFEAVEKEVSQAFQFRNALTGEAADLARDIQSTNSVALHVRRGDYLLSKYKDFYGGTNLDYYKKAIDHIAHNIEKPVFFVFSDDIDWCKQNFTFPSRAVFMERSSEGLKASFHLQLMSLCKHNIITNSTFSWWGAWLNRNSGKIVIAPRHWTQSSDENEDIIVDTWTKI